jgi:hypothetical protein
VELSEWAFMHVVYAVRIALIDPAICEYSSTMSFAIAIQTCHHNRNSQIYRGTNFMEVNHDLVPWIAVIQAN